MSTDFEDRIARLNAKNGGMSAAPQSPAPTRGRARDSGARAKGAKGSLAKYILVGILVLVVMPIGAAMGTIYLAQTKATVAGVSVSVESPGARSE